MQVEAVLVHSGHIPAVPASTVEAVTVHAAYTPAVTAVAVEAVTVHAAWQVPLAVTLPAVPAPETIRPIYVNATLVILPTFHSDAIRVDLPAFTAAPTLLAPTVSGGAALTTVTLETLAAPPTLVPPVAENVTPPTQTVPLGVFLSAETLNPPTVTNTIPVTLTAYAAAGSIIAPTFSGGAVRRPTIVDTLELMAGQTGTGFATLQIVVPGGIAWTADDVAVFGRVAVPYVDGVATFEDVRPNTGGAYGIIEPAGTTYKLVRHVNGRRRSVERIEVPDIAGPAGVDDVLAEEA